MDIVLYVIFFIIIVTLIAGIWYMFSSRIQATSEQITTTSTHIDESVNSLAENVSSQYAPITALKQVEETIGIVNLSLLDKYAQLDKKTASTSQEMKNTIFQDLASTGQTTRTLSNAYNTDFKTLRDTVKDSHLDMYQRYSAVSQELDHNYTTTSNILACNVQAQQSQYNTFLKKFQIENTKYQQQVGQVQTIQTALSSRQQVLNNNFLDIHDNLSQLTQTTASNVSGFKNLFDKYYIALDTLSNTTNTSLTGANRDIATLYTTVNTNNSNLTSQLNKSTSNLNSRVDLLTSSTNDTFSRTISTLSNVFTSNMVDVKNQMINSVTDVKNYTNNMYGSTSNQILTQQKQQTAYTDSKVSNTQATLLNYVTNMSNVHSISGQSASFNQISMPGVRPQCRYVDPGWTTISTPNLNKWYSYVSMCKDNEYMTGVNLLMNDMPGGAAGQGHGARILTKCCKIPGLLDEANPIESPLPNYIAPNYYTSMVQNTDTKISANILPSLNTSFRLQDVTTGQYMNFDGNNNGILDGTGIYLTFQKPSGLYDPNNIGAWALASANGTTVRHSGMVVHLNGFTQNNYDFAWVFQDAGSGQYTIYNYYGGGNYLDFNGQNVLISQNKQRKWVLHS